MKAAFNDSAYRMANGKEARGRGNWAFSFDGSDNPDDWFFCNDLFSFARKAAAEEAKRRGASSFELLS